MSAFTVDPEDDDEEDDTDLHCPADGLPSGRPMPSPTGEDVA